MHRLQSEGRLRKRRHGPIGFELAQMGTKVANVHVQKIRDQREECCYSAWTPSRVRDAHACYTHGT